MNVEAVSLKKFYKNKESMYKNIMIVAKRARQIIDTRYIKMQAMLNIDNTDQLIEFEEEDILKPKGISIAMKELFDNKIQFSNPENESENDK